MNESGFERSKPIQTPLTDLDNQLTNDAGASTASPSGKLKGDVNSSGHGSVEVLKDARLHFMGIGGQGISAVAQMALQEGARISGCDQSASATTNMLMQKGVPVEIGHNAKHLANADALIYVPAIVAFNPDNPELVAAKTSGMPVMTWQELMGNWMQGKLVLSVSGVHGKGTTTAMLALMLVEAGLDPTCEIGAIVPGFGANYRIGKSQYFVNEADEFNNNFWNYHPRLVIVTSIEFEHPEFFADYATFLNSFEHFIRGMDMQSEWPFPPTLIMNADSPGCLELRERLHDWTGRIMMYAVDGLSNMEMTEVGNIPAGTRRLSDYTVIDVELEGKTSFRVRSQDDEGNGFPADKVIHLRLPGVHNIQNALAALTAARCTGIHDSVIIHTLENFSGIERRFEIRYEGPLEINGVTKDVILIDDYAHHPTAITATLEAARRRFPGQRLIAVYQPHMYSRTKTFFEQFLTAFDRADVVMIADIFPGREHDTGSIHARELVEAMGKRQPFSSSEKRVKYSGNVENTAAFLRDTLRSGDVAIVMGAGDIYAVTEKLLPRT